ncbi:MAG: hypothetical protein LBC88_05065, partial [Spirochaetaceae bacterium]|nr:hypothetical protein [Spirochaetaceae bacterium]
PGTILSDDEGFLHVVNKSPGSIVTGVEYNIGAPWIEVAIPAPAGMSGNIAAGQASSPDLILPRGSWAIRFRVLGKDIPTVAVSRTIIAGQVVDVEYTDSLLTDRPPSGFGSLRIVNKLLNDPITRVVVRTQVNDYAAEEVGLSGPIPQGGGSQVRALRAGDTPGSRRDYIVQCYVATNEYYEEVARVIDETISEVFITEDSSKTTVGGGGGGGSATAGALTVYNHYSGKLPFKVFKIYLYKETASGVWQDYVPPANAAYPKAPTASNLRYNGMSDYSGEPFMVKGGFNGFTGLPEGAYKLLIVGGSYHWAYYTANPAHTVSGITINEKLIAYDCGNIFIAGGAAKVYNFDPYTPGVPDRDTPTGAVTVQIHHAGLVGVDGPVSIVQVVAASEEPLPVVQGHSSLDWPTASLETFYAGKDAYVFGVVQSNQTVLAPQASINQLGEGGVLHSNSASGVPERFIVYQFTGTLSSTETLEFCLPPGVYAVRVFDPQGTGLVHNLWYGRNQRFYCDLHIVNDASKTVALQWKNPSLSMLSTNLARANFSTVNVRYFNTGSAFVYSRDLRTVTIDTAQYRSVDAETEWYYSPACTGPHGNEAGQHELGAHYRIEWHDYGNSRGSVNPWRLNLSDGYLYGTAGAQGSSHGFTVQKGGYYTAVFTLEPKAGYTFTGWGPSGDPPVDPLSPNNQGVEGINMEDGQGWRSTNGPGYNNSYSGFYRIRLWERLPAMTPWVMSEGMIQNTGKLPGVDRIKVRVRFRQAWPMP